MSYVDIDELAAIQKAEWERRLGSSKADKRTDVYTAALERWGALAQTAKACEELAELQKELLKAYCLEADNDHIAEEIADVEIMLEQMKRVYADEGAVEIWKAKKLNRLWERVNG